MKMQNTFGKRLKDLRLDNGLGQEELAKNIHVSKGIISLWENGLREPCLSSLIAVAKYFEVSIDYLAGLIDYEYIRPM